MRQVILRSGMTNGAGTVVWSVRQLLATPGPLEGRWLKTLLLHFWLSGKAAEDIPRALALTFRWQPGRVASSSWDSLAQHRLQWPLHELTQNERSLFACLLLIILVTLPF